MKFCQHFANGVLVRCSCLKTNPRNSSILNSKYACSYSMKSLYRPHPKDGEGTVFTGVCLSTIGGGTPVPGSFPGHWSQVLSRGGTPVLAIRVPSTGCPQPGQDSTGLGYPSGQNRTGVPPPIASPGWGTPSQDWGTTPWDRTAE